MNKLKQVLRIIQQHWFISLLVVSGILIISSAIFQALTPKTPVAPLPPLANTGVDGVITTFNNLRFSGSQPSIPDSLSVYTVLPGGITPSQVEQDFMRTYALEQTASEVKIWSNADYSLSATSQGEYSFTRKNVQNSSVVLSQTRAISAAREFLNKHFAPLSLIPIESEINYFGGINELQEVTRNRATIISVPFSYAIESYPVYFHQANYAPFFVTIGASDQVIKAYFQSFFIKFTSPIPYNTISVQEAVSNIQKNKGSLIQAHRGGEHGAIDLSAVSRGTLNSASIVYRVDKQQQYAYPHYSFDGEFYTFEGDRFFGTVVTPAIQTE
jgi:hypothetical protein